MPVGMDSVIVAVVIVAVGRGVVGIGGHAG
jgi:hypothetical protein